MPFEQTLNLAVTRRHKDGVTITCPLRPDFLNNTGIVHGGVIAAIADEAAWYAVEYHYGTGTTCTTTELKVNYLRAMKGERITARATIARAGQTLCVSRVDVFDEKKNLSALAIVTYMVLPPKRR